MPYIEQQEDEDEKARQAQDAGPLELAQGGPAGGAPAAPGAVPAPSQNAGGTPGRYVNFQRYFSANQQGATSTGNKLAGGIETQGGAVQDELGKLQNTFDKGVAGGMGAATPVVPPAPTPDAGPRVPPPAAPSPSIFGTPQQPLTAPRPDGATPRGAAPVPGAPKPAALTPEPVAPPPARAPVPTRGAGVMPTAARTPGPALAGAHAAYTGPESLSQNAGWADLFARAGKTKQQANATGTAGGTQALLQEANKGQGYGTGQSRFDAGMVGAASGDRFEKLRQRFGGLPQSLSDADTASRVASGAARGVVDKYNAGQDAEQKRLMDIKTAKIADEKAAAALKDKTSAEYKASREGKPTWESYQGDNQIENTVKDIGEALDPVAYILRATGNKTPEELLNAGMERTINQNGGSMNSAKLNWGSLLRSPEAQALGVPNDFTDSQMKQLYESLSTEELRALEGMPVLAQIKWIAQRWKDEVAPKAKAALQAEDQQRAADGLAEDERLKEQSRRMHGSL